MIKALIFDLDGTLAHTLPAIAEGMNLALVELGYTNVKEFGGIIDWKYEIEQ